MKQIIIVCTVAFFVYPVNMLAGGGDASGVEWTFRLLQELQSGLYEIATGTLKDLKTSINDGGNNLVCITSTDTFDYTWCLMKAAFGMTGTAGKTVATANFTFAKIVTGTMWFGGLGVMMGFVTIITVVLLFFALIQSLQIYITSLIALVFLTFVSPVIIPMALLNFSRNVFFTWAQTMLAYTIMPCILIIYLVFMLVVVDSTLTISGGVAKRYRDHDALYYVTNPDGSVQTQGINCAIVEKEALDFHLDIAKGEEIRDKDSILKSVEPVKYGGGVDALDDFFAGGDSREWFIKNKYASPQGAHLGWGIRDPASSPETKNGQPNQRNNLPGRNVSGENGFKTFSRYKHDTTDLLSEEDVETYEGGIAPATAGDSVDPGGTKLKREMSSDVNTQKDILATTVPDADALDIIKSLRAANEVPPENKENYKDAKIFNQSFPAYRYYNDVYLEYQAQQTTDADVFRSIGDDLCAFKPALNLDQNALSRQNNCLKSTEALKGKYGCTYDPFEPKIEKEADKFKCRGREYTCGELPKLRSNIGKQKISQCEAQEELNAALRGLAEADNALNRHEDEISAIVGEFQSCKNGNGAPDACNAILAKRDPIDAAIDNINNNVKPPLEATKAAREAKLGRINEKLAPMEAEIEKFEDHARWFNEMAGSYDGFKHGCYVAPGAKPNTDCQGNPNEDFAEEIRRVKEDLVNKYIEATGMLSLFAMLVTALLLRKSLYNVMELGIQLAGVGSGSPMGGLRNFFKAGDSIVGKVTNVKTNAGG